MQHTGGIKFLRKHFHTPDLVLSSVKYPSNGITMCVHKHYPSHILTLTVAPHYNNLITLTHVHTHIHKTWVVTRRQWHYNELVQAYKQDNRAKQNVQQQQQQHCTLYNTDYSIKNTSTIIIIIIIN